MPQQLPAQATSSSEHTQIHHGSSDEESKSEKVVLRLKARQNDENRRVTWDAEVKDSRKAMKTSKKCCIFHKKKEFGESDSESCSSEDEYHKRDRPTKCSRKGCNCNTTFN
ncbi:hypothetical protein DIPPA_12952 [Diplonema papillatum]|nr:hypothetical protein DIPPA_12952 [Diplonema papillatum]